MPATLRWDWGTICAGGWSAGDATVVCRQLGYSRGSALDWQSVLPHNETALKAMPMLQGRPNCTGAEARLQDCPLLPDMSGCGQGYNAIATCK